MLKEQIEDRLKFAALANQEAAFALAQEVDIPVLSDVDGLCELACHEEVDIVVVSIVGSAGLRPTLEALKAGKKIALANKETLVSAGHLVMEYADQIVPIDSEHSALWQCLEGRNKEEVSKLILTASGGPFRNYKGSLEDVTIEQALNHPSWKMGGKITIDSATLMNKGLEVIEAHWFFGTDYDDIEVIIHPQSIVHSLVRFVDGSLIAQLGTTDMRLPIQYALTYPDIRTSIVPELRLEQLGALTFESPDFDRFPCLNLAYQAGRIGGITPTVLNAANEVAVAGFMGGKIGFMDIPRIVEKCLADHEKLDSPSLEEILAIDQETRVKAQEFVDTGRMIRS